MTQKRVLVLGATGTMGKYLVPILAEKGFLVDAVALDDACFQNPNVGETVANNPANLRMNEYLKNRGLL